MQDYRVKGVAPDMTEAAFLAVLRAVSSPVSNGEAKAVYSYCLARGFSPAALLAWFNHESGMGKNGWAAKTKSWGNTRPPSFGVPDDSVYDQDGGGLYSPKPSERPAGRRYLSRYLTWADGGVSTVARFFDHAPYQGKETVREIVPIWAPSSDGNNVENYIAKVLADIARFASVVPPGATKGPNMPPKPPMTTKPSPNKGYKNGHTRRVDAICWHITEGTNSLPWLTNPQSGASSNYLIARDGTIYELVPPTEDAWANGKVAKPDTSNPLIAKWLTEKVNGVLVNFNQRTVSIEHEGFTSKGKGGSLTTKQVDATVALTAWLCEEFDITPDQTHLLGHYEIDSVDRKNCPGFSAAEWSGWVGRVAALVNPPPPAPSGMMEPVVTERRVWGGKGRKVAEQVTVVNDSDPAHPVYYSRKVRYDATGEVMEEWEEV